MKKNFKVSALDMSTATQSWTASEVEDSVSFVGLGRYEMMYGATYTDGKKKRMTAYVVPMTENEDGTFVVDDTIQPVQMVIPFNAAIEVLGWNKAFRTAESEKEASERTVVRVAVVPLKDPETGEVEKYEYKFKNGMGEEKKRSINLTTLRKL